MMYCTLIFLQRKGSKQGINRAGVIEKQGGESVTLTDGFLLLQCFSKGIGVQYSSCFISVLDLDLYVCWFDAAPETGSALQSASDKGIYSHQPSLTSSQRESCVKHWLTMKVMSASEGGL